MVLQSRARWNIHKTDDDAVERLGSKHGLHPVVARLLAIRGITDAEQIESFFSENGAQFHGPFLLDGMSEAIERIRAAIARNEKIRIYGDYDADGVCSTALMVHLFRMLGAKFDYYIPHRVKEGYGLNLQALEQAQRHGVCLVVTVDTGISAYEEVEFASQLGLDIIITDHHEPPERLPRALAVINPKKPGCPYPFKQLAGVGVALKVAQALLGEVPETFLQIAAIGTIADLMPLVEENRSIVKAGLKRMRLSSLPGVRALLGVAGIADKELNAFHVGYSLAPRINASGRLDHAEDAVKLLTTNNEQEAEHLAFGLDQLNRERQKIADGMAKEAFRMIEDSRAEKDEKAIVLAHEDWNVGVIGIVASKVLERYYRPTVILSIDPQSGIAKGSARSISAFDMHHALTKCADLLEHFGGHQAAAGMSLRRGNIPLLRNRLYELADLNIGENDLVPLINADVACGLDEVSLQCVEQLSALAPFGMGNPSPKFVFSGLLVEEAKLIGREQQHLKLTLAQMMNEAACSIEALGFGQGNLLDFISPSARVDVLGELSVNEWNGMRKTQMVIQDIRVPQVQVFDWRKTKSPPDRIAQWLEGLRRLPATEKGKIVPLFIGSADDPYSWPSSAPECASSLFIVADETGQWIPLQEKAGESRHDWRAASDLFFLAVPSELDIVEKALRQMPVKRIYILCDKGSRSAAGGSLPPRETFAALYRAVREKGEGLNHPSSWTDSLIERLAISDETFSFILQVFEELGLIERAGNACRCLPISVKKDLTESPSYRKRMKRAEAERVLLHATSEQLAEWFMLRVNNKTKMEVVS